MVFIVQQANNFCPAPWVGMYYHSNAASPCCTMKTMNYSPKEYLRSKWLSDLKQQFLENKRPLECNSCWFKEQKGLKSIRTHFVNKFANVNLQTTEVKHLELRESNLCNFACRMCNPTDSVKLERELEEYPELKQFYRPNHRKSITDHNWNEIFETCKGLKSLTLTGGEPMLMKRYYDLLDYLIDIGRHETLLLKIYTNCSVFNPMFNEKLVKFKRAQINMSIDAVGKTAEYQRYGTKWDDVRENIFKFIQLPIKTKIHSTISAYSILDISSLAKFFVELKSYPNKGMKLAKFTTHVVKDPSPLCFVNLNHDLRIKAIEQIDIALNELQGEFFLLYNKELISIRKQLLLSQSNDFAGFVTMTKALDTSRNQSFEETFGYKI